MFRSRLAKGFILSVGLTLALSTAALAEEAENQEVKIQIEQVGGGADSVEATAPDTPVSSEVQTVAPDRRGGTGATEPATAVDGVSAAEPGSAGVQVSDAMLEKQAEVDGYLFKEHSEEIAAKGITVTHTLPTNEFIEVGITPYSEENAEYLYQALGREGIRIVEGIEAIAYEMVAPGDEDSLIYATGGPVEEELMSTTALPVEKGSEASVQDDKIRTLGASGESASASAGTKLPVTVSAVAAAAAFLLGGSWFLRRRKTARG